jgi:hypothetical protein
MRKPNNHKTVHTSSQIEYVNLLIKIESCKTEEDFQKISKKIQLYRDSYKDENYYKKLMFNLSLTLTNCHKKNFGINFE